MKCDANNNKCQEHSIAQLYEITCQTSNYIFADGGLDVMIDAMKTLDSVSCQEKPCYIMLQRVCNEGCPDMILKEGIDVTVLAMRKHKYNQKLQQTGCLLLCKIIMICYTRKKPTFSSIAPYIFESGAIRCIIEAMRSTSCPVVQTRCCEVFTYAVLSRAREMVEENNTISAIIVAMRDNPHEFEIQDFACRVLRVLTDTDSSGKINTLEESKLRSNILYIVQESGITYVLMAMTLYPTVISLNLSALACINAIGTYDSFYEILIRQETVQLIINCMKLHRDNVEIQTSGCLVLGTLSSHKNAEVDMDGKSVVEVVLSAMHCHRNAADVQVFACATLSNMGTSSDNRHIISVLKGHQYIMDVLSVHFDDNRVRYCCLQLLMFLGVIDMPFFEQITLL